MDDPAGKVNFTGLPTFHKVQPLRSTSVETVERSSTKSLVSADVAKTSCKTTIGCGCGKFTTPGDPFNETLARQFAGSAASARGSMTSRELPPPSACAGQPASSSYGTAVTVRPSARSTAI